MLIARPWKGLQLVFSCFLQLLALFYFSSIHWPTLKPVNQRPVLILCNHQSWWDGVLLFILHQKIWKASFFAMMLFDELKKRKFLTLLGAFSIQKNHRSMFESISYASKLLRSSNHVVVFPQGRLESPYKNHLSLGKGIQKLIELAPRETEIWALSIHYSSTVGVRNQCHIYAQPLDSKNPTQIAQEWNQFHSNCVETQRSKWY
jgi:1-acyl-sn-glycerol-3-phosphate acyltransferase